MGKTRQGWPCATCGTVTVEFRGGRAFQCRHCGGTDWHAPVRVLELDAKDALADERARQKGK